MNRRAILLVSGVLACSACIGDKGKLEIRSVDRGLLSGVAPVPYRIAEARGHLALGNVALALEGFRKAARDDPASMEALAGMADCYARMTRFDLARRYYEAALALAPRDRSLLASFAAVLDRQGLRADADAVRAEIAVLASAAPPQTGADNEAVGDAAGLAQLSAPAPVGRTVTIALPPARPIGEPLAQASPVQTMTVAPVGKSVTIALPPPRPAPVARSSERSPRLERLSLGEVALVTSSGTRWKRIEQPSIAKAMAQSPELRVLNAARVDKLAARTRTYLRRLGWGEVMIGDAAMARTHSLILYPQGKRAEARKLSASLGFATAQGASVRQVTVLLGRDAASHAALRLRG